MSYLILYNKELAFTLINLVPITEYCKVQLSNIFTKVIYVTTQVSKLLIGQPTQTRDYNCTPILGSV